MTKKNNIRNMWTLLLNWKLLKLLKFYKQIYILKNDIKYFYQKQKTKNDETF